MHIRINWSLNVSEVFHFFLVNTVVMLCFLNKSSLVKNFDLSSVLPVDPVKYSMTNITFFFGWKLHLLPGMKPVSSSSPEIYLAIMWMQKHGLYASGKREWAFSLAFSLACGMTSKNAVTPRDQKPPALKSSLRPPGLLPRFCGWIAHYREGVVVVGLQHWCKPYQ